ncbi:MAG: hypothetical protein HC831_05615 [Chloroflexia bacterium]|nr:hypothetical protein [Chloroflexia bacterium]
MKKAKCEKCRKYTYVYEYHILPQAQFGKDTDTIKLCGNCHTEYHQCVENQELRNPSVEFHYEKFFTWLMGLTLIGLLILGLVELFS